MHILAEYEVLLNGVRAVVIGRSNLVGLPLAALLMKAGATVTTCHSGTPDMQAHAVLADVLISAAGSPHLVKGTWVKPGATVLDVGITKVDGEIVGDVDFEDCKTNAGIISTVPGGVGPVGIAVLI
jgi:methylenetetrahydrofolate dehydrogenase (NADP+)/methenyltetrahydrofolate cyclohydrolase